MLHLKSITIPQKATIIVNEPNETPDESETVQILNSVFGFILSIVSLKGANE